MIAHSIRLEQDKFSRRRAPQRLKSALKVRDMNLQLMPVRIEEVKRITLAVILLPMLHTGVRQTRTQSLVIRVGDGERDVIVGRIRRAIRQLRFEGQTYPEFARSKVRALVPASYRTQPQRLAVEAKSAIQISNRKRYVVQARNHIPKANIGCPERCPL